MIHVKMSTERNNCSEMGAAGYADQYLVSDYCHCASIDFWQTENSLLTHDLLSKKKKKDDMTRHWARGEDKGIWSAQTVNLLRTFTTLVEN